MSAPSLERPRLRGVIHRWSVPVAIALFAILAVRVNGAANLAAVFVYGACVTSMLAVSAVYHSGRLSPVATARLKRVDHSTILLAIAGSYTAVITLALSGTTQTVLLVVTWVVAAIGISIRLFWLHAPYPVVAAVYVVAGWMALVDLPAYLDALTGGELTLVVIGGLLYTAGAGGVRAAQTEPVAIDVRIPRDLPHAGRGRRARSVPGRLQPRGMTGPASRRRR